MTALRGRPPKPSAIKKAEGNRGKRPENKNEPKPSTFGRVPPAPPFLCDDGRAEWDRVAHQLSELGLLTELDISTLAAYCNAFGRWITAERAIREEAAAAVKAGRRSKVKHSGLIVLTSNKNAIQSPLVGISRRAAHDMLRFAAEFGMTPSARSRIDTERAGLDAEDPAARYF